VGGGDSVTATPPTGWNYVDSIAARALLPTGKVPPARGWRRVIYNATFGLINPVQSPDELRHAELMNKIRTPLRGHYKIGVLGKGGVGKTTVAASVGSIFARLRQDESQDAPPHLRDRRRRRRTLLGHRPKTTGAAIPPRRHGLTWVVCQLKERHAPRPRIDEAITNEASPLTAEVWGWSAGRVAVRLFGWLRR